MKLSACFVALLLLPLSAWGQSCETTVRKPGLVLQECGNLSVLFLQGKPVDRARAMGTLLQGPLDRKVVDYFANKVLDAVPPGPLSQGAAFFFNQVVRLLHRAAPPSLSEELDAMAEAMGVEGIYLRRAVSLPDIASGINALGSFSPFRALPAAGCTSIALQDEEGSFVYGRNLDFAGAEIWDKHPLLLVSLPEEGSNELKHLVFGADGALFGGITGANEAGITFAVHQNYSKDASLVGVPMMMVGEMVLREARNLEEAVAVLRKYRPALLWTFVLTDLKTGEAISVESSRRHLAVHPMQSRELVQTNHIADPGVKKEEFISVGTRMNSIYRKKKAFDSLETVAKGGARAEAIAKILAYQENEGGEITAYQDILKAHTIQTVLLEGGRSGPETVHVSMDQAPTAGGRFATFRFQDLFSLPEGALSFQENDFLKLAGPKRARQREISQAFHAYFDEKDLAKAYGLLSGHKTFNAALFRSIVRYQQGFYAEAVLAAEEALGNPRFLGEPLYIRQSLQWVKLAALLRLGPGKREEARSLAADLKGERPQNLRLAALADEVAGGKEPSERLLDLKFEFFSGDIGGRPY